MSDENKIRDAADAIKGIVEAVPVYQDVVQPAAQEIGTALQTVAKTIHVALAPISALVWGYDQIKDFVSKKVTEKLKNVPLEKITTPKANVAGPALEALKYTGHEETLREMYANLLAASMDVRTAAGAHPAFVEIIKQLTPDEARIIALFTQPRPYPLLNVRQEYKVSTEIESGGFDILTNFSLLGQEAKCEFPNMTPTYLDNICRLGLAEIPILFQYTTIGAYDDLEKHEDVLAAIKEIETDEKWKARINRSGLKVTQLGTQFCNICVISHEQKDFTNLNEPE